MLAPALDFIRYVSGVDLLETAFANNRPLLNGPSVEIVFIF